MARNKYPEETVKRILDEAYKLFFQKGYDDTSIQNIIDKLGGLSKGAIYHHFKSKEDIFNAILKRVLDRNIFYYSEIRDDKTLNGYEKLKKMFQGGYMNPDSDALKVLLTPMERDPRFFLNLYREAFEEVVPNYVRPIIEQGVADGSIKTDFPKELGEVTILLMNFWVNPIVTESSPQETLRKLRFLSRLLHSEGLDLLDEETIEGYERYTEFLVQKK